MHFTPSSEYTPNPEMKGAACRDLTEEEKQLFFGTNNMYMRAKRICAECPVREPCLRRALEFEHDGGRRFGVWGGMTARERAQLGGDEYA